MSSESPKPAVTGKSTSGSSRRDLLRAGALAAGTMAFPTIVSAQAKGANDRVRVACIGVGGKGDSDSNQVGEAGMEVVALCDVDENTLNKKAQKYPNAKKYRDWRKLLSEMDKSIDAVTVSTPDHMHGLVASTAMRLGKHVYCQKPLTQTVYEARTLRQLAKDKKVATQMGNQGSAGPGLRRSVEVIQAGLIGQVKELHVWSNRPIWPQGLMRPEGSDPVPSSLDWDLWLGPAQMRPYKKDTYHTFKWRGWYDFGTGALGDMACHTVNMPFRALKMGYPTVVENEISSRMYPETFPKSSRIRFEFPEREGLAPLKFWWYDGNPDDKGLAPLRPSADVTKEIVEMRGKLPGSGALLIGEKGKIFSADDYGATFYVMLNDDKDKKYRGGENHDAVKAIPETLPRAPGTPAKDAKDKRFNNDLAMKLEWLEMMKSGTPSYSNFDIAAYLTEIILLGCIAMRVGEGTRMEWDGPKMTSPNVPDAAKFVKRENRKGWEFEGAVI
jgi:hypothetical protein